MKRLIFLLSIMFIIQTVNARDARYRIEPFAIGSFNKITGVSGDIWELSPTFGAGFRIPVVSLPLNLSLSLEGGKVSGKDTLPEFTSILTSILLEYEHDFHDHFRLIAGGGIANMLISASEGVDITKPFAGESENEFGVTLAVAPTLVIRKFSLGLLIQNRHIFSSPEAVNIFSSSISGGWRF